MTNLLQAKLFVLVQAAVVCCNLFADRLKFKYQQFLKMYFKIPISKYSAAIKRVEQTSSQVFG